MSDAFRLLLDGLLLAGDGAFACLVGVINARDVVGLVWQRSGLSERDDVFWRVVGGSIVRGGNELFDVGPTVL